MTLDEIPIPQPGPNEVRIRNCAAALNFFDILQIQGKYQIRPPFPFTPGAEVAGVVDAVGSEVKHVFPGDPVAAMTHNGAFAEYSLAAANRTFHIIAGMDFAEAAAMPIVYHTSYFALHRRAALAHREWLLVHAGASGVGMSAIQIGKAYGAQVIATAGQPGQAGFLPRPRRRSRAVIYGPRLGRARERDHRRTRRRCGLRSGRRRCLRVIDALDGG